MASVRFKDKKFYKKAEYFSEFIQKNDRINLILGSSLIENSVIPDSLGPKWFAFANPAQNIYESYKFIDYYKDSVKIDTIIIGIQPFDFPYSYIKNRANNRPYVNGNFHIYSKDSITILGNSIKKNLQIILEENYLDIDHFIENINEPNSVEKTIIDDVWTEQGFAGNINNKGVDLDSLYTILPPGSWRNVYFLHVEVSPNLFYFDLFESLTNLLGINVIYLITPKSKNYHSREKEMNHHKIWNSILDSLNTRPIELWNYEAIETDTFDFYYYWHETHVSYQGAKHFTKIIKNRLSRNDASRNTQSFNN